MMYNKTVEECFFNPKHVGIINTSEPRTVFFSTIPFDLSVKIDLYMQCNEDHTVHSMRFKTNGNPYLIAALECLCKDSIGRRFEQLYFNRDEMISILEIPVTQSPLILQVQDVFKEVINLMKTTVNWKGE